MKILLVNPNQIEPPLPPIGLDYISDHLAEAGHRVVLYNFAMPDGSSLHEALLSERPDVVGITVRNVDNCLMFSPQAFILDIKEIVEDIRGCSDALVVLGGAGFSLMPMEIAKFTGADFGVVGDGEIVFPALLNNLNTPERVNNVIYWDESGELQMTETILYDVESLATPSRSFVDHAAYARSGGICNVQTKRGCNQNCIYCPEPQMMGRNIRRKSVGAVIEELQRLVGCGISQKIFFVDSEYNVDYGQALEVAEAIIRSDLRITWSCYMTADNVDKNLIQTMNRAGCETIIWSIDSASEVMLETLGKGIGVGDIHKVSKWCDEIGQKYVHVLLFGGPGETEKTIDETYKNITKTNPLEIGIVTGIRIYPKTKMLDIAMDEGLVDSSTDLLWPVYYRENYVHDRIFPHVRERFTHLQNASIVGPSSPTPFTDKRFRAKLQRSESLFVRKKKN